VAIAGGVEIMSAVPLGASRGDGRFGDPFGPLVFQRYGVRFNQGVGAEMIAKEYGLSRTQLDQHALDSHARAARAIDEGRFAGQIAPVPVGDTLFDTDEGVRRGPHWRHWPA
jgi:acetyl-CoA acyltransferase